MGDKLTHNVLKEAVRQSYLSSGRRKVSVARVRSVDSAKAVVEGLLVLAKGGFLCQRARYTCPNGHSWDSKVLSASKIECPRCHDAFPADEVDAKVQFAISDAWREALDKAQDGVGEGGGGDSGEKDDEATPPDAIDSAVDVECMHRTSSPNNR